MRECVRRVDCIILTNSQRDRDGEREGEGRRERGRVDCIILTNSQRERVGEREGEGRRARHIII